MTATMTGKVALVTGASGGIGLASIVHGGVSDACCR